MKKSYITPACKSVELAQSQILTASTAIPKGTGTVAGPNVLEKKEKWEESEKQSPFQNPF